MHQLKISSTWTIYFVPKLCMKRPSSCVVKTQYYVLKFNAFIQNCETFKNISSALCYFCYCCFCCYLYLANRQSWSSWVMMKKKTLQQHPELWCSILPIIYPVMVCFILIQIRCSDCDTVINIYPLTLRKHSNIRGPISVFLACNAHKHPHTHTHTHTYTYVHTCTQTYTFRRTLKHMYTYVSIYKFTRVCLLTYVPTPVCADMRVYIHFSTLCTFRPHD